MKENEINIFDGGGVFHFVRFVVIVSRFVYFG